MNARDNAPAGLPARAAAQSILGEVLRRRRPLDAALERVFPNAALSPRDAGFARAIASETLRRFGQLDALIRELVPKTPPPHKAGPALELLLAGACELLFLGTPAHAAVDAANRLAARDAKAIHFKPLINAVLRRAARDGAGLIAKQDASRLNTPDWLWERWCETYGEERTRAIAETHAKPAPLDLVMKDVSVEIPDAIVLPGGVIRMRQGAHVETLPGYSEGTWWVRDFAATLPARLFGDVRGKRAIDLCAAPGGKTAQLIAMGANVTAVERDHDRLLRLKDNLERMRFEAAFIETDMRDFMPESRAPFVLLDAPCSATGTIRRHPDLPWIKSAADVMHCASAAGELFDAAAAMVAPGGMLVFAVCSLEPEEGSEQAAGFLARHGDFQRVPIAPGEIFGLAELLTADGDLRTLPCHLSEQGGMDGFYAARLRRSG